MSKISLFKKEWIDLVFEGRNKKYGAYKLRSESPVTTSIALGIGVVLFVGLILSYHLPGLIGGMLEEKEKEKVKLVEVADLPEPIVEDLPPEPPVIVQQEAPKSVVDEIKLKPLEAADEKDVPDEAPPTLEDLKDKTPANQTAEGSPEGTINIGNNSGQADRGVEPPSDEGIYDSNGLAVKPTYPGGMNAFYKYVGDNFRTPEIDNVKTIKVFVSFVVEKDGSMTQIQALRDPGHGLGKEAERVLKSMKKKWEPGIQNGKAVRAKFNLPITINVNQQ